jgi:hypothetical protein
MAHYIKIFLLVCIVVLGFSLTDAMAQEQAEPEPDYTAGSTSFGVGLTGKYRKETYGDDYEPGYGIMAMMDYPFIPLLDLTAGIGWNTFPDANDGEAADLWEFVGGMRFRMGVFFMSGELGYYTTIEETSFLPGLGLRFDHFEVAWNIRAVKNGSWSGLRLGYYF